MRGGGGGVPFPELLRPGGGGGTARVATECAVGAREDGRGGGGGALPGVEGGAGTLR